MARPASEEESWDDDAGNWPGDEDDDATMPCPYCGREMYDDSPRCPHCGEYISEEDAPSRQPPWWIVLGVLLCLAAMLFWLLGM